MRTSIIAIALVTGCGTPPVPDMPNPPPEALFGAHVDVSGWEGFFSWAETNAAWLADRALPFDARAIRQASPRVAKLVIASGTQQASEEGLGKLHAQYCGDPVARAWNEDRCGGLEALDCQDGQCSYQHFGNCSGLLAGSGWFVTAAHCTSGLETDPDLASASAILVPGADGLPAQRLSLGEMVSGKKDWSHHWVALDDRDPVDVAAVRIEDGGLEPFARASLPAKGDLLFVLGYPRVEGRAPAAVQAAGYTLVPGTPSVSFGRLADPNLAGAPLCNVDGNQETWALRSPCPAGEVGEGDEQTWKGPIAYGAFLTTYDSCNGYSGGPVFDVQGRWVGINYTLASDTNPQDAFVDHARMVATPVERGIQRLGLEL